MKKVKGTFISLIALFLVLALFPTKGGAEYKITFADLYSVPWAEDAIYYLADRGIINGYSNGQFGPKDNITREQAASILVRQLYPNETSSTGLTFSDVKSNSPHYNTIAVALDHGLFNGYPDGTFKPKDKLTRAAAAKILALAYNLTGQDAKFKDINQTPWATDYINALATNGITSGYSDNTFRPNNSVTRAEFSLFLARILDSSFKAKKEKVYQKYDLYYTHQKFPIKLSNGLTIGIKKDETHWPVILKDGKEIWSGSGTVPYGDIQFAVTEDNDTFLYHKWSAGGEDMVDLVGVHANGEVFSNLSIGGDGAGMAIEFLSANKLEVGTERFNHNYVSMADRFTGIYDFKVYSLSTSGVIASDYIDDKFATLAKRGKLKDVTGSIGMNYGDLKNITKGTFSDSEAFLFHKTIKSDYAFFYQDSYDRINSRQQVALMSRRVFIYQTESEIADQLQKYFGNPIEGNVYKAGEYYVTFIEDEYARFSFYIGTEYAIKIVKDYF